MFLILPCLLSQLPGTELMCKRSFLISTKLLCQLPVSRHISVSDEVIWLDSGSAKKMSVRESIIIRVRRPPHIHFATTIHALTHSPRNPSSITQSFVRHLSRSPCTSLLLL